ncbi:MAG: hypothetical protein NPINA01_19950 [Nitrospinaceae bacterium]|nr:MAG: hypothetical protein NPINA01_19950 [Nitrospinaceae bacterium]
MKEIKMKRGFLRLGIVFLGVLSIGLSIPFLKIHHFSAFNSGVSSIIALIALIWGVYEIIAWVAEGFDDRNGTR